MSKDNRQIHADVDLARTYLRRVADEIAALQAQLPAIHRAGEILAAAWREGGQLWTSEGNHILHREMVDRAAGPVASRPLDTGASIMDPVPVVDLIGVEQRDVILLHANTGNSAYTDTIVTLAHLRGCKVIALTQLIHNDERIPPRGASQQYLCERADAVVDIGGAYGDGAIVTHAVDVPICPLSGVTGVSAAWAIVAHAVEILARDDVQVPFYLSDAFSRAPAHNEGARARWQSQSWR